MPTSFMYPRWEDDSVQPWDCGEHNWPLQILKEEGAVPPMPPGAFVKEEQVAPPMPPGAFFKEEGVVPPMPPGAFVKEEVVVKRELEVVVDEGGRSEGRPKRRRNI